MKSLVQADEMMDGNVDIMNAGIPAFLEEDPEKKQELMVSVREREKEKR